ncbi:MAG TPA: phage tail sheath subtilisin-like domain-containing protein [Gaiellaceae bacterium]
MPEFIHPGVFVEEVSFRSKSIEGVSTSTAGFVGATAVGPTDGPVRISSLADFERTYGYGCRLTFAGADAPVDNYMWHAARVFFAQGGERLFVQRVIGPEERRPGAAEYELGLRKLEKSPEVAIVAAPGEPIAQTLVEHAERTRYRFAVVDPASGQTVDGVVALRDAINSSYAALYYPWVRVHDPITETEIDLPPSGFVAGIYARNDINRGVFKAPADEPLTGAAGLATRLSDREAAALSSRGINALRSSGSRHVRLWGARTMSANPEWKYVHIRRYFLYLEHSIDRGTQWTVFDPNGEDLWASVRSTISDFLLAEFRRGALAGDKAEESFVVRCDRITMTQNDLDNGRLVCVVGVAPLWPAEFVDIHVGRWTADHHGP